ncbi:hypothetical protein ACTU6U_14780 [Microbacterium sp. A196]|uniref:hypothetical protein n=1 Tax=Microbacterium sp. A196 TaxID=3457320 RepID=UPI003FD044E4
MHAPTSAELHAHADALWRPTHPDDLAAARYADAAALLLSGRPGAQRRATNWAATLHRYEDHWREVGHAPREKTRAMASLPTKERNLGEWARYQRRFEDQLNAYQSARLDLSPAFEWDPLETLWRARFIECVTFVQANRRLPRLHADDRVEFASARWLGRQLLRLQDGRLDQKRTEELHGLLRFSRH